MLKERTARDRKTIVSDKDTLKKMIREQRSVLSAYQTGLKEAKIPVMVIFEGWGAAGKGFLIGRVIRNLDPRFYTVHTLDTDPLPEEQRRPFLYRYMKEIPQAGRFGFFDTCWMTEVTGGLLNGSLAQEDFENRIREINTTERQLTDNGYVLLKYFLQIDRKEQKKRLEVLQESADTRWRVNAADLWENKHYDTCYSVYDRFLEETDSPQAPWYVIDAVGRLSAEYQVLLYLNQAIGAALENRAAAVPIPQNRFPLQAPPLLRDVDLSPSVEPDTYKKELKKLQSKLSDLHNRLYRKQIPVIICYEGWDAAGKGGNIRRITEALDARGYTVWPIASPQPDEKARHYLWRFWTRLPKTGHIAVFDRTWYGRVMVERLEGFCSENDWQRAYNEINEFEEILTDWGAVVIKFWVQIDKDTQLARFTDRQNTPEKQWKITDEDWRNREKWDLYEEAVNEMLQKTSTSFAPWHILESNDKKYARLKALRIVIEEIEKQIEFT